MLQTRIRCLGFALSVNLFCHLLHVTGNMCTISIFSFVSVPFLMHQHFSWLVLLLGWLAGQRSSTLLCQAALTITVLHAEGLYFMHRCLSNLADECATSDHGGCWHKDYTVNGKTQTYSACQDNIKDYKVRLAAST